MDTGKGFTVGTGILNRRSEVGSDLSGWTDATLASKKKRRILLLWWLGAALVPGAWALYAQISQSRFVPGPVEVAQAAWPMITSGEMVTAAGQSGVVFFSGLLIGVCLGLAFGMFMGIYRTLYALVDPYISAVYTVPSIAVIPILVVILGWGALAKIIIISYLVFLPVTIHAATGVRQASVELIELSYAFCGRDRDLWRDVLVPSALPTIFPGLRIATARALTGLIVAEFSTLATGLGYVITRHAVALEIAASLVPVVLLALVGYGLKSMLDISERRLIPWALR